MNKLVVGFLLIVSSSLQAMEQAEEELFGGGLEERISKAEKVKREAPHIAHWGKQLVENEHGKLPEQAQEFFEKSDPEFKSVIEMIKNNRVGDLQKRIDKGFLKRITDDAKLYLIHLAAEHDALSALLVILENDPKINLENYKHLYPCPKLFVECSLAGLAIVNQDKELAEQLKKHHLKMTEKDKEHARRMDQSVVGDQDKMQLSSEIQNILFGKYHGV